MSSGDSIHPPCPSSNCQKPWHWYWKGLRAQSSSTTGLSLLLHNIFETRLVAGQPVALRNKLPTRGHYLSVLKYLQENEIIRPDADFYRYDDDDHRCSVFQVLDAPDGAPEEIASIVDPFCYLSHISAMEHHTLVPRNSEDLVFLRRLLESGAAYATQKCKRTKVLDFKTTMLTS